MSINTEIPVRVVAATDVAEKIRRIRLERRDGAPLPVFSAGAHVVVSMQDGGLLRRNPYSLMSAPHDTSGYEISVLAVENSRGGSAFMHRVREGDELIVSQPVNLFPADHRGRKHLLVAGGIGITPFLAMAAQFERDNTPFELHYAMRSRQAGAYWQDLLTRYGGHRVKVYFDAEGDQIPLPQLLDNQPLGTHLYVCGPAGMIDAVLLSGSQAGWPRENLHSERFLAPPTGQPFKIFLEKSQISITVGEHQSVLEAIEAAGIDAPYMCRGGACGQCETGVSHCDGELQHNDIYLSDEEKRAGNKVMICVSRFKGQQLVLQL
ncbi:oxidoreductase [Rhizobium sp. CG5]|uniref:PDR/VanB family oxidoreductase n=1 Tax=Rhizobium sp. CG5 TaxID=2726076 RepID=UPI0020343B7F|nr:oxidoreductase [Rhizobium sp. CG5]